MTKDPTDIKVPDLFDRLNADPKAWIPGEKDCPEILIAMLLEVKEAVSTYGPYPLYEVVDAEGTIWMIHAFHASLAKELGQHQMGTIVGIKRGEKTETANGQPLVPYRVVAIATKEEPAKKADYIEEPF